MKLLYLDQHHWVALLRSADRRTAELAERLQGLVDSGEVVVVLTSGHYLETWHRAKWGSRSALAALMRDVSRLTTLAPIQVVARHEIERALVGGPPVTVTEILGTGVNHAFASATGRFRLVERAWTHECQEEGPAIQEVPGYFVEFQAEHPEAWEWLNLAGPPAADFPLPGFDDSQFEIRPEHRRGDEFVEHERELLDRLSAHGLSARLRDALVLSDIVELLDEINAGCIRARVNPDRLRGGPAMRGFHAALPSRDLLVDLRSLRLQDRNLPLEQHDRTDLLGLAVALVYCDVVVTERRWAHFARRARTYERYGTEVRSRLDDLLPALTRPRESSG